MKQNSQLNKHIIDYNNLVIGMHVQDNDGDTGIIKECKDIHNVLVEYDNGGSGLHCLVEECIETTTINGQLVEISQYSPLYYCD